METPATKGIERLAKAPSRAGACVCARAQVCACVRVRTSDTMQGQHMLAVTAHKQHYVK